MKEAPIERPSLPVHSDAVVAAQAATEMNAQIDAARVAAESVGGKAYKGRYDDGGDHFMRDTYRREEIKDPTINLPEAHRINNVKNTGFINTQDVEAHATTMSVAKPGQRGKNTADYISAAYSKDEHGNAQGVTFIHRFDKDNTKEPVYKHKFTRPETAARFTGLIAKQLARKLEQSTADDQEKVA